MISLKRVSPLNKISRTKVATLSALFALIAALATPMQANATERSIDCLTAGQPTGSFTVAQVGDEITVTNATSCSGAIVIPSDVTYIGIAFQNKTNITSIEIGSGVRTIAGSAFANCSGLRAVTFAANSNLSQIGDYAFERADIRSLTIPASVTLMREAAFIRNANLSTVTFETGAQIQEIGRRVFFGTDLTSISIPASVTRIGHEAFKDNYHLGSITFEPNSQLTSIGEYAFEGSPESVVTLPASLRSTDRLTFGANIRLSVPNGHQYLSLEDDVLFNADKTELVFYPGWKTGTSYSIPSTVTTISPFAFESSRLTSVNVPASVSTVSNYAFYRSSSLATVTFGSGSNLATYGEGVLTGTAVTSLVWPTSPTRSGYRFLGWSNADGGSLIDSPTASALAGQRVYAVWQSLTHAVNFDSNSGSAVSASTFVEGASINAPVAPTRDGFTFTGWSATSGGSVITFPYSPSATTDITLFALWAVVVAPEPEPTPTPTPEPEPTPTPTPEPEPTPTPTPTPEPEPTPTPTPTQVSVSVGSTPASRVATIPVGVTAAAIPATAELPRVSLSFAAVGASASATVAPIENPAPAVATPFAMTSTTKIVDIQVTGVTGPVTVCLDGAATNKVFHFTGGAWETLPQLTYVDGQVCGVTESFSPFAAAEAAQETTYAGPLISGRTPKVVSTEGGVEVAIAGERLASVTSVTLDGAIVPIVSKSDGQLVIKVPSHKAGVVDLVLKSDTVSMTFQDALEYKTPVASRIPVTTLTSMVVGSAKSLTNSQRKAISSLVSSATPGAVLNCSATYVTKSDAKTAKSLALAACAQAKKANVNLVTRLGSLVQVKAKSTRKVLLSLTN